ncbi:hypothetical protein H5411_19690 [Amycolatopsis echigonensis]|uniref:Uncharacterized protein n=1 Tax=Amycolatopsis echigonensis TaxID=2576905 RepID=A0A8E2B4H7_9PSEU|nr:hypothetical protein [Amycolatopsis echigonensis]
MRNPGRFVTRSTLALGRPALRSSVTPSGVSATRAAERTPVRDGRGAVAAGSRRSLAAAGRVLAVLATILIAAVGTGATAFADNGVVQAETTSTGFGMLGPVGLVAVGFGVIGMALGVVRQRRKARAKEIEAVAAAGALDEEPTRPLEPVPAALNLRQS